MSGVLQGSVLGPALFIIYINDIDVYVYSSVLKFAEGTKFYSNVCTCDWMDRLECDLDEMSEWSTKWRMSLNDDICKCLHVEQLPSVSYSIGGVEIKNVKAEADLGVNIGYTLDSSLQFT